MPTLASCLGKSVLPEPYKKRLRASAKSHSLSTGMKEAASMAIDDMEKVVSAELDQMLKQLGLAGAPVPVEDEVRASLPEGGAPFYSRLNRTVEQSKQGKASGAQWKATIKASPLGVNAEEYKTANVDELEDKRTYTRAEVADQLALNEVKLGEVIMGAPSQVLPKSIDEYHTDSEGEFVYRRYSHFGVPNHVGLITEHRPRGFPSRFTVNAPNNPDRGFPTLEQAEAHLRTIADPAAMYGNEQTHFERWILPGSKEGTYREVILTAPKQMEGVSWEDGHSPYSHIKNPVVRLRFDERTTADGKRMMFLEEVQPPQAMNFEKMPKLYQNNWRELAFKWALNHATKNGFDSIGWTTGKQQADRYNLRKFVDKITWQKSRNGKVFLSAYKGQDEVFSESEMTPDRIEEVAGKGIASKISESERDSGRLVGLDLEIGGKGLESLYDRDFPSVVNKLPVVKKGGAKTGTIEIPVKSNPEYIGPEHSSAQLSEIGNRIYKSNPRVGKMIERMAEARDSARSMADAFKLVTNHYYVNVEDEKTIAKELGGELTDNEKVHQLDLTPEVKANVESGQARFSLPDKGVTSQTPKEAIAAAAETASKAFSEDPQRSPIVSAAQDDDGDERRESRKMGTISSPAAMQAKMDNPGANRGTIRAGGVMAGWLVGSANSSIVNRIKYLTSDDPKKTPAEVRAGKILMPMFHQLELIGGFPKITPASTTVDDDSRNYGADVILNQDQVNRIARENLFAVREKMKERFESVQWNQIEKLLLEGNIAAFSSEAERILDNFGELISKRIQLASATGDATAKATLLTVAGQINSFRKGNLLPLASALKNIAMEIPDSELVTKEAAVKWIIQRQQNKSQPPLMADLTFDTITTPIGARINSPLEAYESLHKQLAKIKKAVANSTQVAADIEKLKNALNPKTGYVNLKTFAEKYARLKIGMKGASEAARLLSKAYERAEVNFEGVEMAYEILEALQRDPGYNGVLGDAMDHLNVMVGGIFYQEKSSNPSSPDKEYTGRSFFFNPLTKKNVIIDLSSETGVSKDNRDKLLQLRDDVRQWLTTPEASQDPGLRRSWERMLETIETYYLAVLDPTFTSISLLPDVVLPSASTLFSNIFRLIPGLKQRMITLRNTAREIGGFSMARVLKLSSSMDAYASYNEANTQRERDVDKAIRIAMKAHGLANTGANQEMYRTYIYDPLVSQNQNPGSYAYREGQTAYKNYKILKEDLAAARVQTTWVDSQYKFLQAQGYATKGLEPKDAEFIVRSLLLEPVLQQGSERVIAPGDIGVGPKGSANRRVEGRRGIAYGFKSPRVKEKDGNKWANQWHRAAELDKADSAGLPAGSPEVITHRLALFTDLEYFRRTFLGMMVETNRDFANPYNQENSDTRNQIIEEFRMGRLGSTLDDVANRFGAIEADRKLAQGALPDIEAAEFVRRAVGYIDKWMNDYHSAVNRNETDATKQGRMEKLSGVNLTIAVTGDSPFTKERGGMLGPSTFYRYSQADSRSRGQLKEQVNIHYRAALIEAMGSAVAAIEQDLQTQYNDLLDTATPVGSKPKNRTLLSHKIRKERRRAVRKGKARLTIGQMENAKRDLKQLIYSFERITKSRSEDATDDYGIRMLRKVAGVGTLGVLMTWGPAINNMMQSTHAVMALNHSLGGGGLAPIPQAVRAVLTFMTQFARRVKIPLIGHLARMWENDITSDEEATAMSMGLGKQWDFFDEWLNAYHHTRTGGVSSANANDDTLFGGFISTPVIRELIGGLNLGWKGLTRVLPGEFENAINMSMIIHVRKMINRHNLRFVNYVRGRARTGTGWENRLIIDKETTDSVMRHALPSKSAVNMLRYLLQEVGSLEQLLIKYHERTKHLSEREAAKEPFLTPSEFVQVATTVARDFNKKSFSGELQSAIGKGFGGFIRSLAATFMRAPVQAAGATSLAFGVVPGEDESALSKTFRMIKTMIAFLAMSMMGLEVKQSLMEIILKNGRTVRRPGDIETPGQMASYVAAMVAPWTSWLPALVQPAAGETAIRPFADFSQQNLIASALKDANSALIAMLQTGNVTQPLGDFLERYFPLLKVVSAHTYRSGEPEVSAASRELRFAAPPGVEVRPLGGSGGASIKTPLTPVIRKLAQAVGANDEEAIQRYTDQAVQMQVAKGFTEEAARRSVQRSLGSRSPFRRTFPRKLTPEETAMAYDKLDPDVRERVMEMQGRFDQLSGRAKKTTGTKKTSSSRRSGKRKRSALRSRRRRSSLRSAPSFSYV